MNERDLNILKFLYDRLVHVHKENPQYDYMLNLKSIIDDLEEELDEDEIVNNSMMIYLNGKHNPSFKCIECGSNVFSKIHKGEGNPCFGKVWIHNIKLKESKMINKEDLECYIESGWNLGRKIIWR